MRCQHPVNYKGKTIGTLNFVREKLYYRYEGHLSVKKEGVFRAFAIMQSARVNLGVCIPLNGQWYVRGKIAVKKLNLNDAQFVIDDDNGIGEFVAINENDPFNHLERLSLCRFRLNGDCPEITILEND